MTDRPLALRPDSDSEQRPSTPFDGKDGKEDRSPNVSPRTPKWHKLLPRWEIVGVVLTGIGVLVLAFLVYLYAFTPLTHSRNQHRLLQTLTDDPHSVFSLVGGKPPSEGAPVALLKIPAIGLSQVVVYGTSAADLEQGPGLMKHTAVPGAPGNAVIAGRRVTFGGPFGSIGSLAVGDHVKVVDGLGSFTYDVVSVKSLGSGASSSGGLEAHSWLTLVTSGSSLMPGGRLVVLGRIVGLPASVKGSGARSPGDPSAALGLGGQPAAVILALVWTLLFLFLLLLGLVLLRRFKQPSVTYMFFIPVLLLCGLFACETLSRCLPATL